jgi:hypothetical protein
MLTAVDSVCAHRRATRQRSRRAVTLEVYVPGVLVGALSVTLACPDVTA